MAGEEGEDAVGGVLSVCGELDRAAATIRRRRSAGSRRDGYGQSVAGNHLRLFARGWVAAFDRARRGIERRELGPMRRVCGTRAAAPGDLESPVWRRD